MSRKNLLLLLAILLFAADVAAQDLLVRNDGSSQRVTVLKVSSKRVKYVRYRTEKPVYVLSTDEIRYIEYPDGERDYFGKASQQPENKVVTASVTEVVPAEAKTPTFVATPIAETGYKVGDIYREGDVVGIVVSTTDEGRHGVIASLDEACLAWSSQPRREMAKVGCTDRMDGRNNMAKIAEYAAANSLSLSDFPAAEWCASKGEGWYLPAINEVWILGTAFNGGSRVAFSRAARKRFNGALRNAGGRPLNDIMFYHSSTEGEARNVSLYSHMGSAQPEIDEGSKGDKLFVRAFRKF